MSFFKEPVAPQHEPDEEPSSVPPKKRLKRWLIGLSIAAVVVLIVAFPVATVAVEKILTGQMEAEGLSGSVEVDGNLFEGFKLQNANFAGDDRLQKLQFSSAEVHYSVGELLRKRIEIVSAEDVVVQLDLRKESPRPKKEKTQEKPPLAEQLRTLHALAEPINLDLESLDASIILPNGQRLQFQIGALTHDEGEDVFNLTDFQVTQLSSQGEVLRETAPQDSVLNWQEDSLALDRLELLPGLAIRALDLGFNEDSKIRAAGFVDLFDATLAINSPSPTEIAINLTEGDLDISRFDEFTGKKSNLSGNLETIDVSLKKLDQPIYDIEGSLLIEGSQLKFMVFGLAQIQIDARIDGGDLLIETRMGKSAKVPIRIPLAGIETTADLATFASREIDFGLQAPSIHAALRETEGLVKEEQYQTIPDGQIDFNGVATLSGEDGLESLTANLKALALTLDSRALPDVLTDLAYDPGTATTTVDGRLTDGTSTLEINATYDTVARDYTAAIDGQLPPTAAITHLLKSSSRITLLDPPVIQLSSQGSVAANRHDFQINTFEARFRGPRGRTFQTAVSGKGLFPDSIDIDRLAIVGDQGAAELVASWKEDLVNIRNLGIEFQGEKLATISGSAPLPRDFSSLDALLENPTPIDLAIQANGLTIAKLRQVVPIEMETLTGRLDSDLTIKGTFAKPRLEGTITGSDWQDVSQVGIRPISFDLVTKTEAQKLFLTGSISEGGDGFASVSADLPLEVTQWLKGERSFSNSPLNARIVTDDLSLERFRAFLPETDRIAGTARVNLTVSGTVAKPNLQGDATLLIDRLRFDNDSIPDLRRSRVVVLFDGETLRFGENSRLSGSGGEFTLGGSVGLGQPLSLDLRLQADKALIYRDDSVNVRSDGNLTIRGTLEQATIAGNLGIDETLYYRDIELIPSGIPATSVPSPELPSVDTADSGETGLPIPEPFRNWLLDVEFQTLSPILIRGNLAKGAIRATGRIGGRLGDPQVTMDAQIRDTELELPLSKLIIASGSATLRPGDGFIPRLDIRGESSVGAYTAFVYIYGKASSPKIAFTSDPPLPEPDVLALLATGSTPNSLADSGTATSKAFQVFINEWRKRLASPERSQLANSAADLLGELELSSGEVDTFTGRSFTSATLKITDRVSLYAGFDQEANSRGLVIYSLRSR